MLLGIKLKALPSKKQKHILSQWMGCAKFIWNAKCEEERYYNTFARKYYPVKTYPPIDQKYSHFKNKELSPWLYKIPSQILRNSSSNWYNTYKNFIKGECGKPKRKRKSYKNIGNIGSVHLTKELFSFKKDPSGVTRLYIGTPKYNIGILNIKNHRKYKIPNSIYIKKSYEKYTVSFCYDDNQIKSELKDQVQHLNYLKGCSREFLEKHVVGIDRGVIRPVQCGNVFFDLTQEQKNNKRKKEKYIKRYQRKLSRQKQSSKQREKTKKYIAKNYNKITNIRNDFCHKTSCSIVSNPENKVIILEDLRIKNMTKTPKIKKDEQGKYKPNGKKAKSGLNKSILNQRWYKFEEYLKYKSYKSGKACFKISANYTSQECANCSHTHPDNRKSQSEFICDNCGNKDNADRNASEVIKKRAINLILYSGTELSKREVLLELGRGAINKTLLTKVNNARSKEASKKKRTVDTCKRVAA